MRHLFEPTDLQAIVQMHLHLPVADRFDAVSRTLVDVYGDHVHPGQAWIWSNAGGIMCAISVLHVSLNEYLLFCGSAIGTEGHSGRHRAEVYDAVMAGELRTYQAGQCERTSYAEGALARLPPGETNGSNLGPGCWLLEYARGNIASMFPFALADSLFSTLDLTDLRAQLGIATRLMAREAMIDLKARRTGARRMPNLTAIRPAQTPRTTANDLRKETR